MANNYNSLTSVNATLTLAIPGLFDTAQDVQGFAPGDAISFDPTTNAKVQIGVDGFVAGGFVPTLHPMSIKLMASSPSITTFLTWISTQQASGTLLTATGVLTVPSVNLVYTLTNGYLEKSQDVQIKEILGDQTFNIIWGSVSVAPIS